MIHGAQIAVTHIREIAVKSDEIFEKLNIHFVVFFFFNNTSRMNISKFRKSCNHKHDIMISKNRF